MSFENVFGEFGHTPLDLSFLLTPPAPVDDPVVAPAVPPAASPLPLSAPQLRRQNAIDHVSEEARVHTRDHDYHVRNGMDDISKRSRLWVMTCNNYNDSHIAACRNAVRDDGCQWIIFGYETGLLGTPHLQCAVYFKTNQRRSKVRNMFPGFWFSAARGNVEQNVTYCSKSGNFEEYGVRPSSESAGGKRSAEDRKRKWEDAKAKAISGCVDDIDAEIFVKQYSQLKTIARDYQCLPQDLPPLSEHRVGFWYFGSAGCGKTYGALQSYPNAYRKIANNKWWCGYQGEENVVIDDLDKEHKYMGYHLKIWADRYAFTAEIKGSSKLIRPKNVIVTSNVHPREMFHDDATLQPILRRFHIVWFRKPGETCDFDVDETRDAYVEN